MSKSTVNVLKIREQLPHGYAKMLQKRVLKADGTEYDLNYIRKSLSEKYADQKFVDAAIELLDDLENKKKEIKAKRQKLNL